MENNLVRLKLKQRLNKLASNDYSNLDCWQEAELINKARLQLVTRLLHGGNQYREGDEQSTTRVSDLQVLLTQKELKGSNRGTFFETSDLPDDFMHFKRVSVMAYNEQCPTARSISVRLVEEANVDELLKDYLLKPSFKWSETFATLIGNKARIYTNNDFIVKTCYLTYYKTPKAIAFKDCYDWNDLLMSEQELEFSDRFIELIIDEAVKIAAADVGDYNNHQRSEKSVETGN